jgi:hypothetical protein
VQVTLALLCWQTTSYSSDLTLDIRKAEQGWRRSCQLSKVGCTRTRQISQAAACITVLLCPINVPAWLMQCTLCVYPPPPPRIVMRSGSR